VATRTEDCRWEFDPSKFSSFLPEKDSEVKVSRDALS
jgi:hypothetical protein